MRGPGHLLLLLGPLLLAGGGRAQEEERSPVGQNLVILLIDGYGADLLNRTDAKLQQGVQMLAEKGVQAEYLKPVFPTQSYPNWFSLATGLYVESHNFTADFMYDPQRDAFFQRDEGANDTDFHWWMGGPDPLWYTAGKRHVDVHCYWFANCHKPHGDLMVQVPRLRQHSFKNEKNYDLFAFLPKIMKHVKKWQVHRKQLVLLRYNGLAKALRLFGDDSDAGRQALASADAQVRKIQEEMESQELFDSTNLIVMSDHGLGKIAEDNQFFIEECLADISKVKRVVNNLAFTFVYPEPDAEDSVYFELRVCDQWAPMGDYAEDDQPLVAVYRRAELPERFHWREARFIAPIVLVAKPGAVILTIPSTDVSEAQGRELRMIGGWDNEDPSMSGIFLARGPAFRQQEKLGPIETVDVYQVALNILGVEGGAAHNGSWERVEALLADGWEDRQAEPDAAPGLKAGLAALLLGLLLGRLPRC